jgi:(2Fe-2S) ferredoxin
MGQYRHHVFVCTSGKHCARAGADDVYATLKKGVKEAGLKGVVRVNQAACMNQCGHGPMVVVYPDDVWYADVNVTGARQIVHHHLVGGRPLEGFRYHAPPGDNKR